MGKHSWRRILGSERAKPVKTVRDSATNIPSAGVYHFERSSSAEHSRIHLRIDGALTENSGQGILLINANRVIHLNPTAALMAYFYLSNLAKDEAIRTICELYKVSKSKATSDYAQLTQNISELIRPDGACPVCDLDIEIRAPFSLTPSAPYRMDLALTYRCNNDCPHCYNARPRDYSQISTSQWMKIIDTLWDIGIPHIVFTGGEPTLRDDLPELIAHAESKGQITGLNTNARRLSDKSYLEQLAAAGLDHVQITVESHDSEIHDGMVNSKGAWKQTIQGLRNALETRLYVMTNTTMLRQNSPYLEDTLDFLAEIGVPTVGLNALIYSGHGLSVGTGLAERELPALLNLARQKTDYYRQRLIWYTPTQYCHFDPMQLELGVKGCTAALYNMCVEPDGAVIPCQSYYQPLGNLLSDPWEKIWNHKLSIYLRERQYIPEECTGCALLAECGGGCPLALEAQSQGLIKLEEIAAPTTPVSVF